LVQSDPQAWRHGPVYRDVWDRTGYAYYGVNPNTDLRDVAIPPLDEDSRRVIDSVLEYYAQFSDDQLIDLAHEDGSPWHRVYAPGRNRPISHESMRQYYSGVIARNEARPALPVTVYSYLLQEDMDEIEASLEDS